LEHLNSTTDLARQRGSRRPPRDARCGRPGGVRVAGRLRARFVQRPRSSAPSLTTRSQVVPRERPQRLGGDDRFYAGSATTPSGLDQSFGSGGIVKTNIGGGDDLAENLAVQPDGRIVVVGRATSSTILDMALVCYLADGTLDTGFDGDGILRPTSTARASSARTSPSQPDGKIVAAGYTANSVDTEFALIRANP
jgi:uncharacterized delta-60 repeat protein